MNSKQSKNVDFRQIRNVTLLGSLVNLVLSGLKLLVGFLTGSVALIADGFHSVSDLASDLVVMLGAYIGSLPADENHPYGHGKYETFAALGVSLLVIGAGVGIVVKAGAAFFGGATFSGGPIVIGVASVSVVAKELLFHATLRVARRTRSPSVVANAWHHRSDAMSSVAVLAGGIAGLSGWGQGDQVAGVLVGAMVAVAGTRIGWEALADLSEASISRKDLAKIHDCLNACPRIRGWHRLRTRRVGREVFVDLHVTLDADMRVREAHDVVDQLEEQLQDFLKQPANIITHIEPHEP